MILMASVEQTLTTTQGAGDMLALTSQRTLRHYVRKWNYEVSEVDIFATDYNIHWFVSTTGCSELYWWRVIFLLWCLLKYIRGI